MVGCSNMLMTQLPVLQVCKCQPAASIQLPTCADGLPLFPLLLLLQTAVDIDGHERSLHEFAGKVTLFVNVASQCGYTDSNYKGESMQLCCAAVEVWWHILVGSICKSFSAAVEKSSNVAASWTPPTAHAVT